MRKLVLFAVTMLALSACQESLEEKAVKEASTYTRKNCPWKLTDMITMDSMTFDKESHTFGYHYRLSGNMDDSASLKPSLMREQLLVGIRNMTSAKIYMDEGYAFRYIYRSASNTDKVLFETLFTDKDYR